MAWQVTLEEGFTVRIISCPPTISERSPRVPSKMDQALLAHSNASKMDQALLVPIIPSCWAVVHPTGTHKDLDCCVKNQCRMRMWIYDKCKYVIERYDIACSCEMHTSRCLKIRYPLNTLQPLIFPWSSPIPLQSPSIRSSRIRINSWAVKTHRWPCSITTTMVKTNQDSSPREISQKFAMTDDDDEVQELDAIDVFFGVA